jgi:SAM-dependent methyltransferase
MAITGRPRGQDQGRVRCSRRAPSPESWARSRRSSRPGARSRWQSSISSGVPRCDRPARAERRAGRQAALAGGRRDPDRWSEAARRPGLLRRGIVRGVKRRRGRPIPLPCGPQLTASVRRRRHRQAGAIDALSKRENTMTEQTKHEGWQVSGDAAEVYERYFVPAIFGQWAPKMVDAGRVAAGDRVLDVGCGTGVLARTAADRVAAESQVTGLDLNEGMLAVARRLRPKIDWRQGDATKLPFADATYDVVMSQFSLMYFPDRTAALKEMLRVLRQGGRLVIAVWGPYERAMGYVILTEIAQRRCGQAAADVLTAPFVLGNKDKLLDLFKAAGIHQVVAELRHGTVTFPTIEAFVETEVKGSPLETLGTPPKVLMPVDAGEPWLVDNAGSWPEGAAPPEGGSASTSRGCPRNPVDWPIDPGMSRVARRGARRSRRCRPGCVACVALGMLPRALTRAEPVSRLPPSEPGAADRGRAVRCRTVFTSASRKETDPCRSP